MKMMGVLVLICAILIWGHCYAVPQILSIAGEASNGKELTILGNEFGIKANPGPLISSYDNSVESDNFSSGSIGGDWTVRSSTHIAYNPVYGRSSSYQSNYYVDCPYRSDNYSQLRWNDPNASNIYYYVSFWQYITSPTFTCSGSGGNSKIWRWYLRSDGSTSIHAAYETSNAPNSGPATSFRTSIEGPGSTKTDWDNNLIYLKPYQNWYHIELWVYGGTSGNEDGFLRTLINGRNVQNWNNIGLMSASYPHNANYWRFGVVSGDNLDGGSILLDQVYIDNTQAHVFISNRETMPQNWLDTDVESHNEIQVTRSWNNERITITFNQGSFEEGDIVYLYVVDGNGQCNTIGYALTIGESLGQSLDVNQDGNVNISDVQLVVNVILGNATNSRADVNGDGTTDVSDVQAVVNGIVD